jgi:hypothetical protein
MPITRAVASGGDILTKKKPESADTAGAVQAGTPMTAKEETAARRETACGVSFSALPCGNILGG